MDEITTVVTEGTTETVEKKTRKPRAKKEPYTPKNPDLFTDDELKDIIDICKDVHTESERNRNYVSLYDIVIALNDKKKNDIINKFHGLNSMDLQYYVNNATQKDNDNKEAEVIKKQIEELKEKLDKIQKPLVYTITK